jgi:beta-glucanase (GH16 family)
MKSFLSALIVAAISSASPTRVLPRAISSDPYLLKANLTSIFLETFPGAPGTLPSSTNWLFDLGTSYPAAAAHWGNSESETYTNATTNIQITSNNTLTITPRLQRGSWTSARIETQRSDFAAAKGGKLYIEGCIKLGTAPASKQQGIWPAFWALGSSFRGNYNNWPAASEWDFLETINGGSTMFSTLHCGVTPGGPCNENNGIESGGVPFSRGVFHSVGFMVDRSMKGTWKDETLSWYLDGTKIFSITGAKIGSQSTWESVAHDKHLLLLNVAIGGSWPGAPNNQTIDGPSVGMEVDYVGVWST